MPRIFISYRRADSAATSQRIYEYLVDSFGKKNVFKDVDNIPVGMDFRAVIERELIMCNTMLVVIGPTWLNIADEGGRRRLDDPEDFVRIEIELGLRHKNVRVIPVLVDGASMPAEDQLPARLKPLAFNNAAFLRNDQYFDYDMRRLIRAIRPSRFSKGFIAALVVLFILAVTGVSLIMASSVFRTPVDFVAQALTQTSQAQTDTASGWTLTPTTTNLPSDTPTNTAEPTNIPTDLPSNTPVPTPAATAMPTRSVTPTQSPTLSNTATPTKDRVATASAEARVSQQIDGVIGGGADNNTGATTDTEKILTETIETATSMGVTCTVRTEAERSVTLRVGPGEERNVLTFLPAQKDVGVLGRSRAADGSSWWLLDKNDAAPASDSNVVWVAESDIAVSGFCENVEEFSAPVIDAIHFPSLISLGVKTFGTVDFHDLDGDASIINLDPVGDTTLRWSGNLRDHLLSGDMFGGIFEFWIICNNSDNIAQSVTIQDEKGLRSRPAAYTTRCQ